MSVPDYDAGFEYQNAADVPGAGLKLASFFIPFIGLILFIVWHNNYPNKARTAGKFALIGSIVVVMPSFLLPLLMFSI
jgi:hypothetical protein